jgi:hypothetical protein
MKKTIVLFALMGMMMMVSAQPKGFLERIPAKRGRSVSQRSKKTTMMDACKI